MTPGKLSGTFRDVSALGRAAGFDLSFRQLDAGPAGVQADLLRGQLVTLVRMTFSRAYHQVGMPPAGMKTLGIPFRRLQSWLGAEYEESSILPFDLPAGFDGVSDSGFEACTLSIRDDDLQSMSGILQIPVGDALTSPKADTVIRNGRATRSLRRAISDRFADEHGRLDREHEEAIVIAVLHAALSDSACVDRSRPAGRARAISKAIAYINDHRDEAVTVGDICRGTGLALRTLNRAFRERFGMGPKAYLIRQRLSDVRAELIRAPGSTLVADVANRHSFWHMGQFAKDYRTMFGELPSQTLNRA